jgi:hypothetical protein
MIVYEDMCVGCPPDVCGRGYCPYSKPIPIHVCDRCENNSDDCLYIYNNEELCYDCVYKQIKRDYPNEVENNDNFINDFIDGLDTYTED